MAVGVALQSEACTPPSPLQGLRPREVAGIVSKLLTDVGISSVIWGTMALSYYNVPTVILEIAVVIPDEQFDKATSMISNIGVRRCHCQDQNSSNTCHSFLVPAPPAHWLIKKDFGIDLWYRSSTLWRIDFSPTSPDLVNEEVSVVNGTTVWTCSIRHPKLHKLIEASALLAMRDSDSDYAPSRQYPILYLRQYSDQELRGCDVLGDSEEEQLVKAVYKDIDHMSDNLERGHEVLFGWHSTIPYK